MRSVRVGAPHARRRRAGVEVGGLVTTQNETFAPGVMHGVRADLVQAQPDAAGLRPWRVPTPCPNAAYEARMRALVGEARARGVTASADLFLGDVRAYRGRRLAGTGLEPPVPVWGTPADTPAPARTPVAEGFRATPPCLGPRHLPAAVAGRGFDAAPRADLPPGLY
jgi:hypothetical protein